METLTSVDTSNVNLMRGHNFQAGSIERPIIKAQGTNFDSFIKNAADLKSYLESTQRDLEIEINDESNCIVVRVIEAKTGKTIRQIPSEDLLQLANNIDKMLGLLFDDTA